jgi:predicted permease
MKRLLILIRRSLLRTRADDRDLEDEIRFHLAQEQERRIRLGASPDEAARGARLELGSPALVKERTRAVWITTAVEQLLQDLRFGSRILTKSPGVSATAIVLVALVIGGNATFFSIAHGILHKPAAGVHATGLVTVSWVAEDGFIETHNRYGVYSHFLEHATAVRPIAAFDFLRATIGDGTAVHAARAGIVSANYFDTLGVRLAKGRSFTSDEAFSGAAGLVIVISHHLWQTAFQGLDGIVGHAVVVNGQPATVVGVTEPAFRGALMAEEADFWVPLFNPAIARLQLDRGPAVAMMGRLASGRSMEAATAELAALWAQSQTEQAGDRKLKVRLVPYSATAGGNSLVSIYGNRMLAIFSVVTLLTVLIVCANIANLLIARAAIRQREIALRQSLGASRVRIVRGLLAEGLVLSGIAWIGACVFAWWVSRAVVTYVIPVVAPGPIMLPDLMPDWTVVGYALIFAVLCTIFVTVGPALRTWRQQLLPFLKVGEQGIVQARSRLSRGLVVLQLSFSVLLLTTAGLAHRSLSIGNATDVGFDTHGILLATVNTADSVSSPNAHRLLVEAIVERLRRLPGIESVARVYGVGRLGPWLDFAVRRDRSSEAVFAADNRVSAGFFATLGVPLLSGRDFGRESPGGAPPAIVTRQLAETLWPGQSAVGQILFVGPESRIEEAEIIGMVADAYFTGQASDAPPRYIFFSADARSNPPGEATFIVRHVDRIETAAPAITRAIRDADTRVPVVRIRSLDSQVASETAPVRILTTLLTLFACGSLLIAAIGQYSVVAFDGRRRTREFGLRLALGASINQVTTSVIRENVGSTVLGLLIGFALSAAVGAALATVLYGITPTDAPTYGGVFLLLAAASLIACYLPARRAARVDPLVALRTE